MNLKKFLSLLLTFLMLAGMLASCGDQKETPDLAGGTEGQQQPADTATPADERLDVPEADHDNQIFNVLSYNSNITEYGDDSIQTGDTVNEALITRDRMVERHLGVTFVYSRRNGQYADKDDYYEFVHNSIFAGGGAYDLIGAYSLVPPAFAMSSDLHDLNTLGSLDFTKAWWPSFMVETCTVNQKMFFISGDVSSNLLYNMQGVLVDVDQLNNNMISEDQIFSLIQNGQWTLDQFFTLTKDLSRDDGDGVWTEADFYSIALYENVLLDSFYFATGLHLLESDDSGIALKISDDILSDQSLDVYSMVYEKMYGPDPAFISKKLMREGRCIFNLGTIYTLRNMLNEIKANYGILPFPKYSVNDKYRTLISSPHTQFCIPRDAKQPELSAAVLETMGYASYTYVTPIVFYNVMKLRYSKDENYSMMFDIMREGAITDLGILFYSSFEKNKDPQSMFRNAIMKKVTGWSSNYRNSYATNMAYVVGKINEKYQG